MCRTVPDSVRQGMKGSSPNLNPNPTVKTNPKPTRSKNGVSDRVLTTKKGASHQDSLRSTSARGSAMGLLLCAAPAAPAYPALLHGHLIAPDLAPSLITPGAHWRQLPIKGRGLFHADDVQNCKSAKRRYKKSSTIVNFVHRPSPCTRDLAPSLSTPRAHWRQLPIKGRGFFHADDVQNCKSAKRRYKKSSTIVNFVHRPSPCTRDLAPSLSTPRAHWRQLCCPSKVEASFMHTMCKSSAFRKRRYKEV